MNFFDTIRNLYTKNKSIQELNNGILITINKWLSFDKDNIEPIKKTLKYLFFIEPKHYYYLLFFNIPRRTNIPFLKKPKTIDEKTDKLLTKIKEYLGWSNREVKFNYKVLELTVLKNKKYWTKEFGL